MLSHQKEHFSGAYIQAVTYTAGFDIAKPPWDRDSVDWTIYGHTGTRARLDVQLKCTAKLERIQGDVIKYPLEKKNYDELRLEYTSSPRILVVVFVPEDPGLWLSQTEEQLGLQHCGYWKSIQGYPLSENTSTVTLDIPRSQVFSVEALHSLMDKVEGRSWS